MPADLFYTFSPHTSLALATLGTLPTTLVITAAATAPQLRSQRACRNDSCACPPQRPPALAQRSVGQRSAQHGLHGENDGRLAAGDEAQGHHLQRQDVVGVGEFGQGGSRAALGGRSRDRLYSKCDVGAARDGSINQSINQYASHSSSISMCRRCVAVSSKEWHKACPPEQRVYI